MLYRTLLRDMAVDVLRRAQTLAADRVYSPRDWPTTQVYPCVLVDCLTDRKESNVRGPVEFTATAALTVNGRVEATSVAAARDAIETLCEQIELALFTYPDLVRHIQQFASVESTVELTANGRVHVADLLMTIELEYFIAFDPITDTPDTLPPAAVPLESMNVHADLIAPADPNGTYPNPPFPSAVTPAPRTSGPDGRDEGTLHIDTSGI